MRGALSGLPASWRAACAGMAQQAPARPRVPLLWRGEAFGSVEPELMAHPAWVAARAADRRLGAVLTHDRSGWQVVGDDLTASLHQLALGLRSAGLAHVWRDEQLGVHGEDGRLLGSVERGVCRVLGIVTTAVHLTAWSPDGGFWLQQRAFDKPNDPGLWDTLVGGMVPAGEVVEGALDRETWEEAGLRLSQLQELGYGGHVDIARPAAEVPHGYVRERLHWYTAVLPPGVVPDNQDGEVAAFACMQAGDVVARLAAGEFTPDAGLILLAADAA